MHLLPKHASFILATAVLTACGGADSAPAASREDFKYSKALVAADITWDDTSLEAYIKKPKDYVPGTRMSFVGIKDAQDRADLLLYLKAQTTP